MSNANTFTFTITALDKATATLRAIKGEVKANFGAMTAPVRELTSSLSALSAESGLTSLAHGAEHALVGVLRLGRGITGAVLEPLGKVVGLSAGLGALVGFGAISALIEVAKSGSEQMAELGEASAKTGVGVTALARLHYAAKQSHLDTDLLDKSLFRLNVRIDQARRGKNKEVSGLFTHYFGPKWKSQITDANSGLAQIANLVAKVPNAARKADIVADLFGSRSGAELLPMLARGSAGLRELGEEFRRLHGDVTPAQVKIGTQAVEAWRRLDSATDGLKDAIGLALAPAITDLIKPLTVWISNNRELIGQKVRQWAIEIAGALKNMDWKRIGKDATEALSDIKSVLHGLADAVNFIKDTYDWIDNHKGVIRFVMDLSPFTSANGDPMGDLQHAGFLPKRSGNGAYTVTYGSQTERANDPTFQTRPFVQNTPLIGQIPTTKGKVEVAITADSLPPGLSVRAKSSGEVIQTLNVSKLNVGITNWGN